MQMRKIRKEKEFGKKDHASQEIWILLTGR